MSEKWIDKKEFWTLIIVMIIVGMLMGAFVPDLAERVGMEIVSVVNALLGTLAFVFFFVGMLSYEKDVKNLFIGIVVPIVVFVMVVGNAFGIGWEHTIIWAIAPVATILLGRLTRTLGKHAGRERGGVVGRAVEETLSGKEVEGSDEEKTENTYKEKLKKRIKIVKEAIEEWENTPDSPADKKTQKRDHAVSELSGLKSLRDETKEYLSKHDIKTISKEIEKFEEKLGY